MDAEHVGMSARWFNLTLVKGDEGVEAGEERPDGALLCNIAWKSNSQIMNVISVKSGYATARSKTLKIY